MKCKQSITVYNRLGEIDNKEQWNRTVVFNVIYSTTQGISRQQTGASAEDKCALFLFDTQIRSEKPFMPSVEYDQLLPKNKLNYWTLRNNDYFALDQSTEEVSGFLITAVDHLTQGTRSTHHWEVVGK